MIKLRQDMSTEFLSLKMPIPVVDNLVRKLREVVGSIKEHERRILDICTRKAFENAAVVVAATGGSTNGGLHLPAMANECGAEFTLRAMAEVFQRPPYLADRKPGGRFGATDRGGAGRSPAARPPPREGGPAIGGQPQPRRANADDKMRAHGAQ